MTLTTNQKDTSVSLFLNPASAFRKPIDVLNDDDLTRNEKRAILASWASDAWAIPESPMLRQPPNSPPTPIDEILEALKRLDGEELDDPDFGKLVSRASRVKDLLRPPSNGNSLLG
jgi:hypothetical protein